MSIDAQRILEDCRAIREQWAADAAPTVKIKRIGDHDRPLPSYAREGDSGLDLSCVLQHKTLVLFGRGPHEQRFATVSCGFAFEIPPGYEGQVRPRSSLTSRGIIAHLGTIDSGYRGEVMVILENRSSEDFVLRRGDRIAQLVIAPVVRAALSEVAELSASERGTGGFGSTGK